MKTYKRELAAGLLLWFMYIVEVKDVSVVQVLVWPVFTFAALSFGLDWFGKSGGGLQGTTQPTDWGRSERGSEYSGGQDSNPNLR